MRNPNPDFEKPKKTKTYDTNKNEDPTHNDIISPVT